MFTQGKNSEMIPITDFAEIQRGKSWVSHTEKYRLTENNNYLCVRSCMDACVINFET